MLDDSFKKSKYAVTESLRGGSTLIEDVFNATPRTLSEPAICVTHVTAAVTVFEKRDELIMN